MTAKAYILASAINALFLVGCASVKVIEDQPSKLQVSSCAYFGRTVLALDKSLQTDPQTGQTVIDPVITPVIAEPLDKWAAKCLTERGVTFEVDSGGTIHVLPGSGPYPNDLAMMVKNMTDGEVKYGSVAFLVRPWADASFGQNTLWLPHAAILGRFEYATHHELRHVYSYSLLKDGVRVRHLAAIDDRYPEPILLDEVFAYTYGFHNFLDAQMRTWSQKKAKKELDLVKAVLSNPQARFWVVTQGEACRIPSSLKKKIEQAIACVESSLLKNVSAEHCDAQIIEFRCLNS